MLALTAGVLFTLAATAGATELKIGLGYVQTDGLRLRAKPSTDAEVISTASFCDAVVVIREVDGWYLVDYNLDIGYMSKDYIIFKERETLDLGFGWINSDINIREEPDTSADLVCQAPYGETAYILGINNGWYKVQYEGQIGYVRSDLLDLTEKPPFNAESSSPSYTPAATVSPGMQVANFAINYLGTPYVWGGTTTSGFDCSGFTKYVYKQFGVTIRRTAAEQLGCGYAVSNLQAGDLVFFANTYAGAGAASHVGIYMGGNQFVHAAQGGVKITSLSEPYYASRYVGARRIF